MRINKQSQDAFFTELGEMLTQPATLFVFGGTSLICLGMPKRLTDDMDAYTATDSALARALESVAASKQ